MPWQVNGKWELTEGGSSLLVSTKTACMCMWYNTVPPSICSDIFLNQI